MTVSVKVHIFTLLTLKIYAPLLYATSRYACKTNMHSQLMKRIKTMYLYYKSLSLHKQCGFNIAYSRKAKEA